MAAKRDGQLGEVKLMDDDRALKTGPTSTEGGGRATFVGIDLTLERSQLPPASFAAVGPNFEPFVLGSARPAPCLKSSLAAASGASGTCFAKHSVGRPRTTGCYSKAWMKVFGEDS